MLLLLFCLVSSVDGFKTQIISVSSFMSKKKGFWLSDNLTCIVYIHCKKVQLYSCFIQIYNRQHCCWLTVKSWQQFMLIVLVSRWVTPFILLFILFFLKTVTPDFFSTDLWILNGLWVVVSVINLSFFFLLLCKIQLPSGWGTPMFMPPRGRQNYRSRTSDNHFFINLFRVIRWFRSNDRELDVFIFFLVDSGSERETVKNLLFPGG